MLHDVFRESIAVYALFFVTGSKASIGALSLNSSCRSPNVEVIYNSK